MLGFNKENSQASKQASNQANVAQLVAHSKRIDLSQNGID